jgi:hypothetical protein
MEEIIEVQFSTKFAELGSLEEYQNLNSAIGEAKSYLSSI